MVSLLLRQSSPLSLGLQAAQTAIYAARNQE
jgi:hypothetical protein